MACIVGQMVAGMKEIGRTANSMAKDVIKQNCIFIMADESVKIGLWQEGKRVQWLNE